MQDATRRSNGMLKAARKTCRHIYKKKNSDVTFTHTLKSTRPLLVQQSTAYATTEVVGSVRLFITYTRVRWVHLGQMGNMSKQKVDVLQKSEELKQARTRDIDLLEKAKENKMQYEENLKSHASTMNEEMVKEANAKIAYILVMRYLDTKPNGKQLIESILKGPYQMKLVEKVGNATNKEAINFLLLGLPDEVYKTVYAAKRATRNGFDKRPIETNIKFLNHIQQQWRHFVSIVKKTRDFHTVSNNDNIYSSSNPTTPVNASYKQEIDDSDPMTGVTKAMAMLTKSFQHYNDYGNIKNAVNGVNNAGARNVENYGKGIETTVPQCYNCPGFGHIARNYTPPLRKRESNFFKQQMQHPEQPESINDTYVEEHNDSNIHFETLNMVLNEGNVEQHETNLEQERALIKSLIYTLQLELKSTKSTFRSVNKRMIV
ncbi:hypothetical protein Tco_0365817 [Tanacetum coccineum]